MLVSAQGTLHRDYSFLIRERVKPDTIACDLLNRFNRGVTFLGGEGGFSQKPKRVILTVTTLTEVPKIKEMIFAHDAKAFVIINNTFEVLGQRHGSLKTY